MSGPRRHGSRRSAAACLFVLLVLAFALASGSVASAHSTSPQHKPSAPTAGGGLLGRLGTVVGHTVDGLLSGVGAVLGNRPHTSPTNPAPTPTPKPSPRPTPRPTVSVSTTAPPTASEHRPGTRPAVHRSAPAPAPGTPHSSTTAVRSVRTPRHRIASAVPVAASSSTGRTPAAARSIHRAAGVDSSSNEIPGLDITASLAALMIALVLGVGLIVYRAGYRGARTP